MAGLEHDYKRLMMGVAEKTQRTQEQKFLEIRITFFAPLECRGIDDYSGIPHIALKNTKVCFSFS